MKGIKYMDIHELFEQQRRQCIKNVKQTLYEYFNMFESLNYIRIEYNFKSLQMNIYLEFYEDEYLLEELNNPNYVETTFYNLDGALPLGTKVNYDLITITSSNESVAYMQNNQLKIVADGEVTLTLKNKNCDKINDKLQENLKIYCINGVNVYNYSDLMLATDLGQQVAIQSDIMLRCEYG